MSVSITSPLFAGRFTLAEVDQAVEILVASQNSSERERATKIFHEIFDNSLDKTICCCSDSQLAISIFNRLITHEIDTIAIPLFPVVCSELLQAQDPLSGNTVGHIAFERLLSQIDKKSVSQKLRQTIYVIKIIFSNLPLEAFRIKNRKGQTLFDLADRPPLQHFQISELIKEEQAIRKFSRPEFDPNKPNCLRPLSSLYVDFEAISPEDVDFVVPKLLDEAQGRIPPFENEFLLGAIEAKNICLALKIIELATSQKLSYIEPGADWYESFPLYVAAFDNELDDSVPLALLEKLEPDVYGFQYGELEETLVQVLLDELEEEEDPNQKQRLENILEKVVSKSLPNHFLIRDKNGIDALYAASIINWRVNPEEIIHPMLYRVDPKSLLNQYGVESQTILHKTILALLQEEADQGEICMRLPTLYIIIEQAPYTILNEINQKEPLLLSIREKAGAEFEIEARDKIEAAIAEAKRRKKEQKETLVLGLLARG